MRGKPIKVLHLRSSGGMYGAEGVILDLTKELNKIGCENYILNLKSSKNPHEEMVLAAQKHNLYARSIECRGRFDFTAMSQIRRFIKDYNINIIHMHDYKADFFGFCAGKFLGVKYIATNHLWTNETLTLRVYEFLDAFICNFFDRIISVSKRIEYQVRKYLIDKRKVMTIHNGIDLTSYDVSKPANKDIRREYNIKPDTRVIGTIGRLSVQKGHKYLFEAAKDVVQKHPNVAFLIVGDGELRAELKEQVKRLELEKYVIFTGVCDDMLSVYKSLDLFVMSSISEGLPLVLLEALAMERPAIVTNVGDIDCVVRDNMTGLLLESKNPQALAQAIIELLEQPRRAKVLGQEGRNMVKKYFASPIMAQQYKDVYVDVLKN